VKVVYISGPFTASTAWQRELNVRAAEAAALEVWRLGAVALCPHTNARNFEGELPYAGWIAGDLEMLRRCDAVLLLRGWADSRGAQVEHGEAIKRGIPCFSSFSALSDWLGRSDTPEEPPHNVQSMIRPPSPWTAAPSLKCRECGETGGVKYRVTNGDYEDTQYSCRWCGHSWWVKTIER